MNERFKPFTSQQEETAKEILSTSSLKDVGLEDEGLAKKPRVVMESVGGEYNPYASSEKKGLYPEGERGERAISDKEAKEAAKKLEGTEAEKWELL